MGRVMILKLTQAFARHELNPTDGMNLLQQHAVISDNCVGVKDIYPADCLRAMQWLEEHFSVNLK